jgi:hypothetical protein
MPRHFAQVLDETLAAASAPPEAEHVRPRFVGPQVLGFFDFTRPGRQPFSAHRHPPAAWSAPAPRVSRRLTPAQRAALDDMVRLGASLTPDFTDAELRSAFRALARQHHPDRFPTASELEKARHARQFTRLHAAYRTLRQQPAAQAA